MAVAGPPRGDPAAVAALARQGFVNGFGIKAAETFVANDDHRQ